MAEYEGDDHRSDATGRGRRQFLKLTGTATGAVSLVGVPATATSRRTSERVDTRSQDVHGRRTLFPRRVAGSGPLIDDRPSEYTGRSMLDLPDLRGELTVYLGGGEGADCTRT